MFEIPSNDIKEYRVTLEYAKSKFENSKMAKLKIA
jgi:hypothetical protein